MNKLPGVSCKLRPRIGTDHFIMNKYLYIFIICNKLNAVQERCRCILFYVSYHQLTPKRPCGPNGFEKLMCFKQSTLAKVCVVLQTSPVTMT